MTITFNDGQRFTDVFSVVPVGYSTFELSFTEEDKENVIVVGTIRECWMA